MSQFDESFQDLLDHLKAIDDSKDVGLGPVNILHKVYDSDGRTVSRLFTGDLRIVLEGIEKREN